MSFAELSNRQLCDPRFARLLNCLSSTVVLTKVLCEAAEPSAINHTGYTMTVFL